MRKIITVFLLLAGIGSLAQTNADTIPWQKIEAAVMAKQNLEDIRNELLQVKIRATAGRDDIAAARSLYLLMHIADRKTEDTWERAGRRRFGLSSGR